MMRQVITLWMALLLSPCSSAFVIQSRSRGAVGSKLQGYRAQPHSVTRRFLGSSDNEAATPRKRRRKRKGAASTSEDDEEEDAPVVSSRSDSSPVEFKVQDVRDLVEGGRSKPAASSKPAAVPASNQVATMTAAAPSTGSSSFSNIQLDDSLETLLQDAKRMQEEGEDISEGDIIKAKIRNALSNIVTADFFVVCAFLLWFLLGIFCSYILKDDTVQIAFNSK
jgi:hypothetical protein